MSSIVRCRMNLNAPPFAAMARSFRYRLPSGDSIHASTSPRCRCVATCASSGRLWHPRKPPQANIGGDNKLYKCVDDRRLRRGGVFGAHPAAEVDDDIGAVERGEGDTVEGAAGLG